MLGTTIDFQFAIDIAAKTIVRDHAANRALDEELRVTFTTRLERFRFMAADIAGEAHVFFLHVFLSADANLIRIDNNDKIAGIDMRSENGFIFAAQQICNFNGDMAEQLVLGVNDPPRPLDLACFG